jgi:hypothetical protein
MTKIFLTVSLAALCAALGCDEVADQPERDGSTSGDDGDLDLESDDNSRCAGDSADAEGCVCTAGAPPRACSSGAEGDDGKCSSGVQECVAGDSSEIESSTWGPCQPTGAPDAEACVNDPKDDCNGTEHDCKTDGNDRNCCATQLEECLGNGEPPSVCASLDDMCVADSCDGLATVCDPTSLPVSKTCARVYYGCFNFRVNKCIRESYDTCLAAMGDAALCAAWDAACSAREAYCEDLLGGPCETSELGCTGEEGEEKGNGSYYCTDWGHVFDPCWVAYQACNQDAATCEAAMHQCVSNIGDIYQPLCGQEEQNPEGDKDTSG